MKLPKFGLRGAVKGKGGTTSGGNRAGSPLTHDPVMIDLLVQLDSIGVYDTFHRWRAEFLERLDELLEEKGSERAEDAYAVFRVKMEKLVRSVAKIAHYVNDGNLSKTRVSSKAHGALNDGMIACETIASRLKYLAPLSSVEEDTLGFTRYHIAAVLIRDSFEQFERLNMCKDVLQVLRDEVVDIVAGRHMLAEMDKFRESIDTFTALMMENVGLLPVLRKQRQLKPPQPPKALMNEIRGEVLKEALLAKGTSKQRLPKQHSDRSLSGHGSGHKPRSSRRSLTDSSETSASTAASPAAELMDRSKTGTQKIPSVSKRRPKKSDNGEVKCLRRTASMSIVDSSHRERQYPEPIGVKRSMSLRKFKITDEAVTKEKIPERDEGRSSQGKESPSRMPQRLSSFSKRRARSTKSAAPHTACDETNQSKSPSQTDTKYIAGSPKQNTTHSGWDAPTSTATAVKNGLIKFEPTKNKPFRPRNGKDERDDDRSVVSISSKKRAKMKVKQARKGKHFAKTSSRDMRAQHLRKHRQLRNNPVQLVDDLIEIGVANSHEQNNIASIPPQVVEEQRESSQSSRKANQASPRRSPKDSPSTILRKTSKGTSNNKENDMASDKVTSRQPKTKSRPRYAGSQGVHNHSKETEANVENEIVGSSEAPRTTEEKPGSKPYRYNSSVIDKHKRLMKGRNTLGYSESPPKLSKSKPRNPSSKIKMQWPPAQQEHGAPKKPGTEPQKNKNRVNVPSNRDIESLTEKNLSSAGLFNPQQDGKARQKTASKSLPSLLDDCSSMEPEEEEDPEIFDILTGSNHSHSSKFEKRRTMFENLASHSSFTFDFKEMGEDEEDIDPLDLLTCSARTTGLLDASTHSIGLVSEKRSIFEKFSAPVGSLIMDGSIEDPKMLHSNAGDVPEVLDKSLSDSVNIRRALFERNGNTSIANSIALDGGIYPDVSLDPLESIGQSPRLSVSDISISRSDFAMMFFDDNGSADFSSGLRSLRKESCNSIDENPWVRQKTRIRKEAVTSHQTKDDKPENLAKEKEEKASITAPKATERPLNTEINEPESSKSKLNFFVNNNLSGPSTTAVNEDATKSNVAHVSSDSFTGEEEKHGVRIDDIAPFKSPQSSKSLLRLRMDSPLKTRKPWARQQDDNTGEPTQDLAMKFGEPKNQPWKREKLSALEISLHSGAVTKKTTKEEKETKTRMNNECHLVSSEEVTAVRVVLSPEEKGLLVAGQVMKKRIEEEARNKALEQVKREDKRRAEEVAKRQEEADALRMAEQVLQLETSDDTKTLSDGFDNHLLKTQSWRTKAWGSPLDGSQHQTYDKPMSSGSNLLFSGRDHLSGSQPWRSKAWDSPLDGSADHVFEKQASSRRINKEDVGGVFTQRRIVPSKNRSILSEGSGASLKIFEDNELEKSKHTTLPTMKFKPVSIWASPGDDEQSHPLKKSRDKKTRSAIVAKKPMKPKLERMKPQIADDSSVVKVKKSNRQKGEVTYIKKMRPVGSMRKKRAVSSEGWAAPLQA